MFGHHRDALAVLFNGGIHALQLALHVLQPWWSAQVKAAADGTARNAVLTPTDIHTAKSSARLQSCLDVRVQCPVLGIGKGWQERGRLSALLWHREAFYRRHECCTRASVATAAAARAENRPVLRPEHPRGCRDPVTAPAKSTLAIYVLKAMFAKTVGGKQASMCHAPPPVPTSPAKQGSPLARCRRAAWDSAQGSAAVRGARVPSPPRPRIP